MKIAWAFPRLLERRYPYVAPTYPLLTVLNLLRTNDIDAVPIHEGPTSSRVVSGFSSLSKLMNTPSASFEEFLEGHCERGSRKLDSFSPHDDVENVLDAFTKRRLGVSLVDGAVKGEMRFTILTLNDLLSLYQTGQFASDLAVESVASSIVSMPGTETVRSALAAMFRLSHRRVFLSGERKYISDRTIIDRIFDPSFLQPFHEARTESALEAQIGSLDRTTPMEVEPLTSLRTAALQLRSERGSCLTIRGRDAIVTPWDLVVKPWESGNLKVRARP